MARQIPSINKPAQPGRSGGLGEKIEATIERIFAWTYDNLIGPVGDRIRSGIDHLLEEPREAIHKAARPMLDELVATPGLPPSFVRMIDELTHTEPISLTVILVGFIVSAVGGLVMGMMQPISRVIAQFVDAGLESARADPSTAWPMTWRSPGDAAELMKHMKQLGWNETIIDAWREVVQPRLSIGDLLAAEKRGTMTQAQVTDEFTKRGYSADDAARLRELSWGIPGPGDIISMAVRGAFNPDEVRQFNLDAEFPGEFGDWMERQGFSTEWAQRFWASHWNLPSITLGYEMLHRGIISRADLELLIKAQDISPYWRDKLIDISYNPLTRVDVRRMYGLGVLDRDDVKRSYLDLGYNNENAELMTEFTIRYESDADREATKSDILGGFKDGMLSAGECEEWLRAIGYTDDVASYLVAREQVKLERAQLDKQIDVVEDLFVAGAITSADARTRLTALGLRGNEIDRHIDDWTLDKAKKIKRPTQAQYDAFLLADIIDEAAYRDGLEALGYSREHVSMYTDLVLAEKAEKARKAEEAARDEQEATRTRKVKSGYQVEKAQLDVDLAEINAAIAEQQIAMRARKARFDGELDIVRSALTVAELEQHAEAEVAALNSEILDLRSAQEYLAEQVDQYQTQIATIKSQEVELKQQIMAALESAADEEAAATIEAGADARLAEYALQKSRLAVSIEETQDQIAEADTQIAERRRDIANRHTELVTQVDVVGRLTSEADLRAEYEASIEAMQKKLDELRLNKAELTEAKATLAVGYRESLV